MQHAIARPYLSRIEHLLADGKRKLLGLVGPPGGGKSTSAQALLEAFPGRAVVVPMDGFHLANAKLARLGRADRKGGHGGCTSPDWAYMSPEQTGRVNRDVDHRTDLYSLGVTLYRMLTGELPFEAKDALGWVHCHIARVPRPPAERDELVPRTLSDLVMKLLQKSAEQRYQGAHGVLFDLEQCLDQWERSARIEIFTPGAHDMCDRLLFTTRLHGRERQRVALLRSFEQVAASGRNELVLVSGQAGVGKSSLVEALRQPVVAAGGNFICGKFDQQRRDVPMQPWLPHCAISSREY